MGSPRVQEIENRLDLVENRLAKNDEFNNILYNSLFGITVKLDMLQTILMQVIAEMDPTVKIKVLSEENLKKIAETVTEEVQTRLDIMGFGDTRATAPLDQLIADEAKINES